MQTYINNGAIFTADQIKQAHPNTSFPQYLQPSDIEPLGYHVIHDIAPTYDPVTEYLTEGAPILANDQWQKAYTVNRYTAEELVKQAADKLAAEQAAAKALIPVAVTPRQIRQALTRFNLRTQVEAAIAASDQDTKDWYEFATEFRRDHPMVAMLAAGLGVSEHDLDALWMAAGAL